jgi:uncharacterized protein (DUF3084 family)
MTPQQALFVQQLTGLTSLPLELLGIVAEDLSPIDLLALSHTNRQLNAAVQQTTALQERRERAIRAQAEWRRLDSQNADIQTRLRAVAADIDCLTEQQQQRLVAIAEGLDQPWHRVSALRSLGAGVAGIAPELQQRLVAIAEALVQPGHRAQALQGLGAGVAGIAPELQQRLVAIAEGLDLPWHRVSALQGLGAGVAGIAPELQQRLVAIAEGLDHPGHRAQALAALGR